MRSIGLGGQQLVPDGPLAERGDRGALALAGGWCLPGDLGKPWPAWAAALLPSAAPRRPGSCCGRLQIFQQIGAAETPDLLAALDALTGPPPAP